MKIIKNKKKIDEMISKASNIFIVGHKYLDLDAIGSNIGIYEYVKSFNKKPVIIVNDKVLEAGVKKVIDKVGKNYQIAKSNKIKHRIKEDSLLIITDTNKKALLQDPALADLFNNILIIDHHEYNETSINKGLAVVDDKLSSACEMITFLLNEAKLIVNKDVATVILSGIVLDTNNFALKTTEETYKAAYLLASMGAKPNHVQTLLKQNIKEYIERTEVITDVKIYNNIAIAASKPSIIYRREELAKMADLLLQFNGIKASFVIGKISHTKVGVSARSEGKLNVGDVLEHLNGGGNAYEAACQVEKMRIKKVEESIKDILKSFK